jgi:DNA-binding SARP family transcriptional activator
VLLASVRGVLDPEKRWPSDHFVAADLDGIRLDLRHVAVDAETLISDAEAAAALMDDGEEDRAREILADIDRRYVGDALEDETGEEWADGLREEARAAWQRSVRRLAVLARRAGRPGDAQTLLVRLLTADPYDEPAHLQLVRSLMRTGRRGEARRAFARWQQAMADIGAPLPDPRVLGPVVTSY